MTSADRTVYHRVETDEEFIARVKVAYPKIHYEGYTGELLDNLVWSELHMQRRIILIPV